MCHNLNECKIIFVRQWPFFSAKGANIGYVPMAFFINAPDLLFSSVCLTEKQNRVPRKKSKTNALLSCFKLSCKKIPSDYQFSHHYFPIILVFLRNQEVLWKINWCRSDDVKEMWLIMTVKSNPINKNNSAVEAQNLTEASLNSVASSNSQQTAKARPRPVSQWTVSR